QLCGAGKLGRGGWRDGDEVARPAGSGHTGPRGGYTLLWLDLPRALRSPPAVPGVVRVPAGGLLCGAVPTRHWWDAHDARWGRAIRTLRLLAARGCGQFRGA